MKKRGLILALSSLVLISCGGGGKVNGNFNEGLNYNESLNPVDNVRLQTYIEESGQAFSQVTIEEQSAYQSEKRSEHSSHKQTLVLYSNAAMVGKGERKNEKKQNGITLSTTTTYIGSLLGDGSAVFTTNESTTDGVKSETFNRMVLPSGVDASVYIRSTALQSLSGLSSVSSLTGYKNKDGSIDAVYSSFTKNYQENSNVIGKDKITTKKEQWILKINTAHRVTNVTHYSEDASNRDPDTGAVLNDVTVYQSSSTTYQIKYDALGTYGDKASKLDSLPNYILSPLQGAFLVAVSTNGSIAATVSPTAIVATYPSYGTVHIEAAFPSIASYLDANTGISLWSSFRASIWSGGLSSDANLYNPVDISYIGSAYDGQSLSLASRTFSVGNRKDYTTSVLVATAEMTAYNGFIVTFDVSLSSADNLNISNVSYEKGATSGAIKPSSSSSVPYSSSQTTVYNYY